jgi:cytochrome P450
MGLFKFARKKKPPPTTFEKLQRNALQAYGRTEDAVLACYERVKDLQIHKKTGALLRQSADTAGSLLHKSADTVKLSVHTISRKSVDFGKASVETISAWMETAGITQTHLLVGLALLLFVIYITRKVQNRNRQRHKELHGDSIFPPYAPFTMFQTGTALAGKELPSFFQTCAETVGPIFRLKIPFWRGPMIVAVGDVDVAKEILQDGTTFKSETIYSSIASLVDNRTNILTSEGKPWKHARKGISPAFAKAHIDRMHKVCKEKTEEWIQTKLEPAIRTGAAVDISQEFLFLTLSIICKTAFEYRMKDNEAQQLIADLEIATREFAFEQVRNPWRATILSVLLPSVRRAKQARRRIFEVVHKMLQSYRRKPTHLRSQAKTIIGCIEKNKHYDTDDDRIADMVMFLFAGHDTTAYSLAWTFLELARNPKESLRLREALNGNDDMRAQGLLKDVLREGMRLRPVYPGIGVRTLGKDFHLKDKGTVIPKGSQIIFPSMILTRYGVEDAEQFQPSRWTEHPNKSFLLFSSGPHHCAGKSLALAEMTWVLSRLCAQYKFQVVDEGNPHFCVFWKCRGAKLQVREA